MARLFFAIWPGVAASKGLAHVAEALGAIAGGKPVPAEKIHVTLAFLGSIDAQLAGTAAAVAARVNASEVHMAMDEVGSFRRARVGWAGPSQANANLIALQDRLARDLKAAGFALDERAFTPHATLVRKIDKSVPRAPMPPVQWRSRAFTLVESRGGRYEVLESWGLGAG